MSALGKTIALLLWHKIDQRGICYFCKVFLQYVVAQVCLVHDLRFFGVFACGFQNICYYGKSIPVSTQNYPYPQNFLSVKTTQLPLAIPFLKEAEN
jgi:hypothetical protein